jgi:hypothetical protein
MPYNQDIEKGGTAGKLIPPFSESFTLKEF